MAKHRLLYTERFASKTDAISALKNIKTVNSEVQTVASLPNFNTFVTDADITKADTLQNVIGAEKLRTGENNFYANYSNNGYLTFTTNGAANTIYGQNNGTLQTNPPLFYYSYDTINWNVWEYAGVNEKNPKYVKLKTLSFSKTRPLYIKGENPNGISVGYDNYFNFALYSNTVKVYCSGNIMSLLGNNITAIPCSFCYHFMFYDCASLVTAPELPATTLTEYCYSNMFNYCRALVNAPELPATELAEYCYSNMFRDCKALVNAPELPVTKLATGCYANMFRGSYSLVNAPVLPATTLATDCYGGMFRDCNSLKKIVTYQSITPAISYNGTWVSGVAATGTMYAPNGASWGAVSAGNNTYPSGWTLVKSAPPAA